MIKKFFKAHKNGLGLVFLTWFIFFLPILSGKYAYFLDDLKIIYYPIETLYAHFQHNWQLPVWSNAFGFGQPLLAWGQLGFFTPLHLLLRALYVPPLALLQISIVAYFLFGSIGMFVFLLRRNLNQYAAALGAIVFAYCGFNIGHLNHVNFYTSTMLLPWLLIAINSLIAKASLKQATILALVASAIAMSGQPQVVLFVFIAAAIIGIGMFIQKPSKQIIAYTLYAALLALFLSSFAILPLKEFLPETERAAGLPQTELFEFSYPPWHTITLILPYFSGDHANYYGPKGFQELAAYTGIIPLLLAGGALMSWKKYKIERIVGIALVVIGITLVLGKYSIVYQYLVNNHYITSIGVVGRFVFFFDIGIVLLAAIGLQDIAKRQLRFYFGYLLPLILIALPFGIFANGNSEIQERLAYFTSYNNPYFWMIVGGIIAIPIAGYFKKIWILPLVTAMTLVAYGWNYNPRVTTQEAFTASVFIQDLQDFKQATGLPARLYAAEHLPVTGNPRVQVKLSEPISPLFSVFQPISQERKPFECVIVPIQADSAAITRMHIMVRTGFSGTIWYNHELSSEDAFKNTNQRICFPGVPEPEQSNLIISFTSNEPTNMKVFTTLSKAEIANLFFVRVKNPTPKQLEQSKKPLSMIYTPDFPRTEDLESALLMRHVQAVAGASSARWIGALSVRPYREFIDSFFANDSDAFDGDGVHALTRNKKLVDMVGITHFTQSLKYGQTNDPMLTAGYTLVREADTDDSLIRLYSNPNAFPKAFMVPRAEFIAADDEIRFRLRDQNFDPASLVYLSGPTPPNISHDQDTVPLNASAHIIKYSDTVVDVQVVTNKTAYLIVTDATLPQWQTHIDDKPVLQLKANSIFKAAQVPEGTHIVSFRYESPAVKNAKIITIIGLIIAILGYAYPAFRKHQNT